MNSSNDLILFAYLMVCMVLLYAPETKSKKETEIR